MNGWTSMDRENVLRVCTAGYLLSLKKEVSLIICDNMGGTREHYAK
jgi:hypothetical protein